MLYPEGDDAVMGIIIQLYHVIDFLIISKMRVLYCMLEYEVDEEC